MSVFFGNVTPSLWYFDQLHDGELERVGIDDRQLSFDEAMKIADFYGGGEFDDETAGIVAALCALRDHIKAAP